MVVFGNKPYERVAMASLALIAHGLTVTVYAARHNPWVAVDTLPAGDTMLDCPVSVGDGFSSPGLAGSAVALS